ncbi:MAG TPA: biotin/lipoyl-containing protein [Ktedonobacteraceae bacterium]|nr:biotin/lipoyl-containing protein [Ktedonobacteraceae bacterium]
MANERQNPVIIDMPLKNIPDSEEFISISQLKHLIRLIDQSDVSELEVKHGAHKASLILRKAKPLAGDSAQLASTATDIEEHTAEQPRAMLIASHVGVFHLWSRSKDQPFAGVGDLIKEGQQVGLIRAFDIPNEVEASVSGRISEIFVQDGQPVEYGQPLMAIEKQ